MKRLGVFLIYDKHGIIDDYVVYLLEKMKSVYEDLVVVCNCNISDDEKRKILCFSNEIYVRDNNGFDAGGFKDALCQYIGWNRVRNYEELVLFNDSFFGPIFPIDESFSAMEKKACDFWSMTKNTGNYIGGSAIQSYFVVIRKRLLNSEFFEKYWEDLPYYSTFTDVVVEYEMKFASYFEKRGFSWDSYIGNEQYDTTCNRQYRMSLYHTVQNEIVRQQRYPFLKRKLFALDPFGNDYGLDKQARENFCDALEYIKDNTDYNFDYIWKNVLRVYPLRNIQDCCCLNNLIDETKKRQCCGGKRLVIAWLFSQQNTYDNLKVALANVVDCSVIIGTNSKEFIDLLQRQYSSGKFLLFSEQQLFWLYVFEHIDELACGIDYIAFFNDNTVDADEKVHYVTKTSYMWSNWVNILGEGYYFDGVEECFYKQPSLGMLVAPKALHAQYLNNDYSDALPSEIEECLGISEYIKRSEYLADWSECFWIRRHLIVGANGKKIEEALAKGFCFNTLAKCIPYVCQAQGYYTSVAESKKHIVQYSKMQNVYLRYFVNKTFGKSCLADFGNIDVFLGIKEKYYEAIRKFCDEHANIYIYGCGDMARFVLRMNIEEKVKCFVVSNNQNKLDYFNSKPVVFWGDIEPDGDEGIVVALNEKNTQQVKDAVLALFSEKHAFFFGNRQ